nr:hypothetical protein [FCB group bacterium]
MRFVSVLGLVALLGIAWLLSYHKSKVNFKSIIWGIGLQLVFAMIILSGNYLSFVGMSILGLLIVTYILQHEDAKLGGGYKAAFTVFIGSVIVGVILYYVPVIIPYILVVTLLFLIVNSLLKWNQVIQRYASSLLIISGISFLISHNYLGRSVFKLFSDRVADFLKLSDYGSKFLFANLADGQYFFTGPNAQWPGFGFQFAFSVLPTIIFFGGFMSVLYYLGIIQKVIQTMSKFMRWTIGTSGAETLSCSANVFVGQTEAPLLIKPFLNKMTKSELLTIMVGGFATIAGGVQVAMTTVVRELNFKK